MTKGLRYLSVCSGIEAATVAWHPLGWTAVGFAEIDKFASAVLAERFGSNLPGEPLTKNGVPNFGDFTTIDLAELGPVDLLVGGTPCQAFSFAGKRQSLVDARGNLTLAYAVLAHELVRSHGLRNALWENVPGVLSTDDNAFGCFLGAIVGADAPCDLPKGVERWPDAGMVAGPRARAAWRLLDAQYFGLAQRRERVFVVVDFGNGADPAAVLFEPQGLSGDTPPRREARQDVAPTLSARTKGGGGLGTDFDCDGGLVAAAVGGNDTRGPINVATALNAHGGPAGRQDFESETFIVAPETAATLTRGAESAGKGGYAGRRQEDDVNLIAHTLRGEGFDAGEDGTGRGTPIVAVTYPIDMRQASRGERLTNNRKEGSNGGAPGTGIGDDGDPAHTIGTSHVPAVAFQVSESGVRVGDVHATLDANNGSRRHNGIVQGWAVRRLTTIECARLQGFPDRHSQIAWRGKPADECPDGPQYKTYGNSMAVKNMAWLGERIAKAMPA